MRFGDLFHRKSQGAANEGVVDTEAQPRAQHYVFAHRFLPDVARRQGAAMTAELAGEKASDTLLAMWNHVGGQVPVSQRVRPDGLAVDVRIHPPYVVALFTLPPPQAITEVYFTALAVSLAPDEEDEDEDEDEPAGSAGEVGTPPETRYITLEYGISFAEGTKRTVLCEWAYKEGGYSHLNMGDGPDPDLDAFYNRVCVMLG